jgi:hypothetical protein
VINHNRNFGIECQLPDETVHFQFPDPESAKYLWRMCVHQVNNFLVTLIFVLYDFMEKKAPISSFFPQFFLFDFLPAISFLHDTFQYLSEQFCSESSCRSLPFKF